MKKIIDHKEVSEISNSIFRNDDICEFHPFQIAHIFLKIICNRQDEIGVDELWKVFYSKFEVVNLNNNSTPDEYIHYILFELMKLKQIPRDAFIQITKDCINDIRDIDELIKKYSVDKKALDKDKEIEGKRYKDKLLIYYIKKLKTAKNDIVDFLSKKSQKHSINISIPKADNILIARDYRYHFRENRMPFAIENLNEITHKIDFVNIPDFYSLFNLYKEDSKKFYSHLKQKYPAKKFISDIKKRITSNHILNDRSEILNQLLKFYSTKKLNIFINLIPQQIEGLLYDLALELGVKKETLKNSSVSEKAEHIKRHMPMFNDYIFEYFHFVFPQIRNKIAHGMKIKEDISNLSYSLLLDLNKLTELICSTKVKSNKAIQSLKNYKERPTLNNAIIYGEFIDTELDDYYGLGEVKETIEKHLIREFTLENVDPIINSNTVMSIMLVKLTENIRNYGINKTECVKILNKLKKRKSR